MERRQPGQSQRGAEATLTIREAASGVRVPYIQAHNVHIRRRQSEPCTHARAEAGGTAVRGGGASRGTAVLGARDRVPVPSVGKAVSTPRH
jgi:hypothetical protein